MNSKLQIISGKFHGKKLNLPSDARPTQNRAREGLFNMLASGILEADANYFIWDVFAGSGAIGIEFLSRYPNVSVLFSDVSEDSIKTVRKNLAELGVGKAATTEHKNALDLIQKYGSKADFVFLDPPYDKADLGKQFLEKFIQKAKKDVFVLWEQENSNFIAPSEKWNVIKDKTYGRARFLLMQLKNE